MAEISSAQGAACFLQFAGTVAYSTGLDSSVAAASLAAFLGICFDSTVVAALDSDSAKER